MKKINEKELFRYGEYLKDYNLNDKNGFTRLSIIKYEGEIYLIHMFNGMTIECEKLS